LEAGSTISEGSVVSADEEEGDWDMLPR
jgi:hypothetical protein